ncbi:MAG: hypothetical protein D6798_12185 [Deltaproteobacteria bacterium]|nr:MAG: hypothetical protein D6798_12185 [Deltaproteobacteria bacterium]
MDRSTAILLAAVAILAGNRLVLSLPGWHRRRVVFWGLQLVNLAAACFMIVYGVPDLRGLAFYANWVIALLFMLHIVQNNSRYVAAHKAARARTEAEDGQRRQAVLQALRRGEGRDPGKGASRRDAGGSTRTAGDQPAD